MTDQATLPLNKTPAQLAVIPTTPGPRFLPDADEPTRMQAHAAAAQPRAAGGLVTAFDTVGDWVDIPVDAPVVYGYVGPGYVTVDAARARCPHAVLLTITEGLREANEADCEPGNVTWTAAGPDWDALAGFVDTALTAKVDPAGLYLSAIYNAAAVTQLAARGIPKTRWRLRGAHWTRIAHICDWDVCGYGPCDATQYAGNIGGPWGYDLTLLRAASYLPTPAPPAPPLPKETSKMAMLVDGPNLLVAAVDKDGRLHYWQHPENGPFNHTQITDGLLFPQEPGMQVFGEATGDPGTVIHVTAQKPDGTVVHCWHPPSGPWTIQTLPTS